MGQDLRVCSSWHSSEEQMRMPHYLQKVGWWVDGFHTGTAAVVLPSLHRGVWWDRGGMAKVVLAQGQHWAWCKGQMGWENEPWHREQFGSSHWSLVSAEISSGVHRKSCNDCPGKKHPSPQRDRHQQSTSSCWQVSFRLFWKELIGHKGDGFICPFSPYLLHSVC